MSLKKIQYEQSSGDVLVVEKETTGFVPFKVTTSGIVAQVADFAGNVTLLGSANLELEGGTLTVGGDAGITGNLDVDGVSTFNDPVTFNDTVTFNVTPSGFVPTSRSIFTSGGLTGGGNLSTNRTLQIATSGVTTIKIDAGAVTEPKIADDAVTYNKADGEDIMKVSPAMTGAGFEIASIVQTGLDLTSFAGSGPIDFDVTPYVGVATNAALDVRMVEVFVSQSGSNVWYPITHAGNGVTASTVGGEYSIVGGSTNEIQVYPYSGGFFDSASFNNAAVRVTFIYTVQV